MLTLNSMFEVGISSYRFKSKLKFDFLVKYWKLKLEIKTLGLALTIKHTVKDWSLKLEYFFAAISSRSDNSSSQLPEDSWACLLWNNQTVWAPYRNYSMYCLRSGTRHAVCPSSNMSCHPTMQNLRYVRFMHPIDYDWIAT